MPQDFTVDRNSSKWVLGSDGYLKEYANDEAAIEFNADGSYKGVLVEPESVNEAKASEDLDNTTYWDFTRTTIATPSLLCTCDAYESNDRVGFPPFIANKLYTIIPE